MNGGLVSPAFWLGTGQVVEAGDVLVYAGRISDSFSIDLSFSGRVGVVRSQAVRIVRALRSGSVNRWIP